MRVSQGGHDVPSEKLITGYLRTLANLRAAIRRLPHVLIFDNEDLRTPFRFVVETSNGHIVHISKPTPRWLRPILKH